VWKAWSSPENLGQWWGPQGFTTTTTEFELKPGGRWIFTMHGPDGMDYPNEITYTTVRENELVEYEHGPSPKFRVTVRFEDEGEGRTKLSFRMVFESVEERDNVAVKFGAIEGLNQTLGRLREFVASGALKEE
jgi:uncharacterized protein YndB with AHSA1/START domain